MLLNKHTTQEIHSSSKTSEFGNHDFEKGYKYYYWAVSGSKQNLGNLDNDAKRHRAPCSINIKSPYLNNRYLLGLTLYLCYIVLVRQIEGYCTTPALVATEPLPLTLTLTVSCTRAAFRTRHVYELQYSPPPPPPPPPLQYNVLIARLRKERCTMLLGAGLCGHLLVLWQLISREALRKVFNRIMI